VIPVALLAGAGFGLGVLAIVRGLWPQPDPLPLALARLHATHRRDRHDELVAAELVTRGWAWLTRAAGRPLARLLDGLGLSVGHAAADLAITGRTVERLVAEKVAAALAGLLLPSALGVVLANAGVTLPLLVPLGASVALAAAGWLVPDLAVRSQAAERRRQYRHTLGAVLDLTVIALAGGAGVDGALHQAAQTGQDWASVELRRALGDARLHRQPPWVALGQLGERLGVAELVELAATVGLAGTEGARVRASLLAKAAALRAHQHAEIEADAHAATERMSLPVVVMFGAFLLLLGFPAIARVASGAP